MDIFLTLDDSPSNLAKFTYSLVYSFHTQVLSGLGLLVPTSL